MTTGERIKQRRKALMINAEKLAELLNVSPATVYRYEKGEIEKIPGKFLSPIADVLQTTPAYLMGWSEDPDGNAGTPETYAATLTAEEYALLTAYRAAQLVYQQAVIDILLAHPKEE